MLVCQQVVVDPVPFRDLPRKLPSDKDLQACWADGKLHVQTHTGDYGSKSSKNMETKFIGSVVEVCQAAS